MKLPLICFPCEKKKLISEMFDGSCKYIIIVISQGYAKLNPKYPTSMTWRRKGKIGQNKVKIMFPIALKWKINHYNVIFIITIFG